jgi:hypothetical protein
MGLACILRPNGPTHGRPPYSFPLSLGDMVPMVPDLISNPRGLGKRALSCCIRYSYLGEVAECTSQLKTGSLSATQLQLSMK